MFMAEEDKNTEQLAERLVVDKKDLANALINLGWVEGEEGARKLTVEGRNVGGKDDKIEIYWPVAITENISLKKELENIIKIKVKPFIKNIKNVDLYIGSGAGIRIKDYINGAVSSIKIMSPYVGRIQLSMLAKLYDKRDKKIDIRIFSTDENNEYNDSDLSKLKESKSIKIIINPFNNKTARENYFFHSKIYIIDNEVAFIGSVNLTKGGEFYNNETCFTITDKETVQDLSKYFDYIYNLPWKEK